MSNLCAGIVKKGKRCTRSIKTKLNGYLYCTQHARKEKIRILNSDKAFNNVLVLFEKESAYLHKHFGYNKMGLLYMMLNGRLSTSVKKQSVFTWLMVANRLKLENKLVPDIAKHITFLLLRSIIF